jgi:hypothetical protein
LTRVQKNLLTALVLLGGGGGAALYTLETRVKTPEQRFQEEQDAKRLFHFGRVHVTSGRIAAPTSTFAFTRDELFGWTLTEPVRWPADTEALEAALDRMASVLMDTVLTEDASPEDLRRAGLERPRATMQVDLQDGVQHTLHVGALNRMVDRYPITDAAKRRVGLSDTAFYWALDRNLEEFRDPRIFPFPTMKVRRVRIEEGGEVRAELESDGKRWTVSGVGLEAPIAADDGVVGMLLVALTKHTKAERYVTDAFTPADAARFGLDAQGTLTVEVETLDGAKRRARLGRYQETGAEAGTAVAQVEGTTTVAALPSGTLDTYERPAAAYRDRTLSRFIPTEVQRVRLEVAQQPAIELTRDGEGWRLTAPQAALAKVWKVDAVVRAFAGLKVESWKTEASTPAQRVEWLLEPWSRRAIFYDAAGAVLADVRVGNLADEGLLFAQAAESPRVGIIPAPKLQAFPSAPADLVDEGR